MADIDRISTVPDDRHAEQYVSRSISGTADFDVFDYALATANNLLLKGPTGSGKSLALMAYAANRQLAYYSIPSNVSVEPSQLFGRNLPSDTEAGLFPWTDGPVTDLVRYGGVLNLGDVNFLPPRIATVLFPLLDRRRMISLLDHHGEVVRAHRPQCWCDLSEDECRAQWLLIVADMNVDYIGTQQLNEALVNRFAIHLQWDYADEVEERLVPWTSLRRVAQQLRTQHGTGELGQPVSTNMLQEFMALATTLGLPLAIHSFCHHYANVAEQTAVSKVFTTHMAALRTDLAPKRFRRVRYRTEDGHWERVLTQLGTLRYGEWPDPDKES
jgi:hypothetical protein